MRPSTPDAASIAGAGRFVTTRRGGIGVVGGWCWGGNRRDQTQQYSFMTKLTTGWATHILNLLGEVKRMEQRYKEAMHYYEESLEGNPTTSAQFKSYWRNWVRQTLAAIGKWDGR